MVPTKSNEANKPKSRNATDLRGIRVIKAPTVVMLPISKGRNKSLRVALMLGWCAWCTIRCKG